MFVVLFDKYSPEANWCCKVFTDVIVFFKINRTARKREFDFPFKFPGHIQYDIYLALCAKVATVVSFQRKKKTISVLIKQ